MAEPFHVDFTGSLTIGVLGNHLLNCAGIHAQQRGFGIAHLNDQHFTWVLSRLAIEMDEFPQSYEEFSIQTWVENVYRLFTDRNYAILNAEGQPIGYARSIWAMISMSDRKPVDLLTLHGGHIVDYICQKDCPIAKSGRVKLTSEATLMTQYQPRYSDIDINGHVNSVKYMEHILNLFPLDTYRSKRIRRFEIAYVAESYFGDTLSFYTQQKSDNEYDIEIRKNDTETVVRSKLIFDNRV